jgi:hypothetical protein
VPFAGCASVHACMCASHPLNKNNHQRVWGVCMCVPDRPTARNALPCRALTPWGLSWRTQRPSGCLLANARPITYQAPRGVLL